MIPLSDDNPTGIRPFASWLILLINIVVFVKQASLGEQGLEAFVMQYGAVPAQIFGSANSGLAQPVLPPFLTVFSSMFLHAGFAHLAGNMLYLWIFANNVEDAMGHVRFIFFYLLCGVAAALSHMIFNSASDIPMVGASGAISGVLGAYFLLYPHARVLVLVPFGMYTRMLHVPAGMVLGLWFVYQLLGSAQNAALAGGGIAFLAHLGGFLAGMLLLPLFKRHSLRIWNPARRYNYFDL